MNKPKSPTHCPIAESQVASTVSGGARLCCHGEVLLTQKGIPLRVYEDSFIDKFNNHEVVKRVRKNLQEGVKDPYCKVCWATESAGGKSLRTSFLSKWDTEDRSNGKFLLRRVDIRLGNKCNFICAMCNPWTSSSWHELHQTHFSGDPNLDFFDNYTQSSRELTAKGLDPKIQGYLWVEQPEFWEILNSRIHEIKTLHFAGGEPLINNYLPRFLKEIPDQIANDMDLSFITNLSVIKPEILAELPRFREVNFIASIDGVGEVGEFIRFPFKTEKFLDNVKKIQEQNNNVRLRFESTVSILNILSLKPLFYLFDELYSQAMKINKDDVEFQNQSIVNFAQFHFVHDPPHLSLQSLTVEARNKAIEILKAHADELKTQLQNKKLMENFEFITRYLQEMTSNQNGQPKLFMEKLAKSRKIPEELKESLKVLGIDI